MVITDNLWENSLPNTNLGTLSLHMKMYTGVYACTSNHHKIKYYYCLRLVPDVSDNDGNNYCYLLTIYYVPRTVLSTWYSWSHFSPHNNSVRWLHFTSEKTCPQKLNKLLQVTLLKSGSTSIGPKDSFTLKVHTLSLK